MASYEESVITYVFPAGWAFCPTFFVSGIKVCPHSGGRTLLCIFEHQKIPCRQAEDFYFAFEHAFEHAADFPDAQAGLSVSAFAALRFGRSAGSAAVRVLPQGSVVALLINILLIYLVIVDILGLIKSVLR